MIFREQDTCIVQSKPKSAKASEPRGGQLGARPHNAETAGAKVSFRPHNKMPVLKFISWLHTFWHSRTAGESSLEDPTCTKTLGGQVFAPDPTGELTEIPSSLPCAEICLTAQSHESHPGSSFQAATSPCFHNVDFVPTPWSVILVYLCSLNVNPLTPLLPYWYSYKASCARPGQAVVCNF